MGGCLDQPKPKKTNLVPITAKNPEIAKPSAGRQPAQQQNNRLEQIKPKYKKMSMNELLATYKIDSTLDLSCKMQGPKYLSNLVDGSSKVLRVINLNEIEQNRLEVFKKIIGFQIYENEEGSLMLIDQYCAGQDLYDTTIRLSRSNNHTQNGNQLLQFALRIFWIIESFHKNKIWLGNLNFSSFKKVSAFADEVRLVDFNLNGNVTQLDKMGFAHRESFEADFQFMGYVIQFLLSNQPLIFLPHKMQYVQFQAIPSSLLIQKLLKGNKCAASDLTQIKPQQIIVNSQVALGYKFRRDINKLLKMRKKRKAHNRRFYGDDTRESISDSKFQEEGVYRLETDRIFQRISGYIEQVNNQQQEPFMNYSSHNQNLRRLKQVFLLRGVQKKMNELKECLSTIK